MLAELRFASHRAALSFQRRDGFEQAGSRRGVSLASHETFLDGFGHGAAAAADLQLFIDATDVFVSGIETDVELGGGFLDGLALDVEPLRATCIQSAARKQNE